MYQRNYELLYAKIRQYLLPAVMMKLALQLGNVVDTILVGNILGTDAMSAVGLSMPVLSMVQIPAVFLGNGGSVFAGILLGRRQKQEAKTVFTVSFIITLTCNLLFAASSFFITKPLANFLTKGSSMESDVASCIFIFLLGSPVMCMGVFLTRFFSTDSHPKLASTYYIVSNMLNLFFDVLFLKYAGLGVKGSALSTLFGFGLGLVITCFYVKSSKRMLSFSLVKPSPDLLKSIASTGMPHLSSISLTMVRGFVLNGIILAILGEAGIAIFTICNNTHLILKMFVGGIMESFPYVVGVLYGDRDFGGIRAGVRKIFSYAIPITVILMFALFIFTRNLSILFGIRDRGLQDEVILVLRIYVFSIPLQLWNYFAMQFYGAVEKSRVASLVSAMGEGIALILVAYVCIMTDRIMGGSGYAGFGAAFILAELLSIIVFTVYVWCRHPGQGLLLISDEREGSCLDLTIRLCTEDAVAMAREIQDFCEQHGVLRTKAVKIAMAAEEMAVNAAIYGGDSSVWMDVYLLISDAPESMDESGRTVLLRLRDNGIPFDPTAYEYDDSGSDYCIHGIDLIKKASKSITYVRALDLNNTTITV
ncbi:MAG: hypothetical protein E7295_05775 [Lachnospiraceae bacterium]|jgi:Na+-driven multidrug efflux pump|nr:hypothetical protein [Lachnospiraceae bacterium]